jgi:cytochrome P450
VICELIGVEPDDRGTFHTWAEGMMSTAHSQQQQVEVFLHLAEYLAVQIEQRRAQRRDDLLSWLVEARDDLDRLTDTELLYLVLALLVAGYETTARQITNMVYTLLTHPQQLGELRARPELLPTAVDELMRFIVSGTPVNPRIATTDIQVGEVLIRAGDPVLTSAGAANRDETAFSQPEELDLTRHPNPHLSFGHGPHICIGAQLARLELQVSLETILSRLPGLRLAVPDSDLVWETQAVFRGPNAFPVAWDVTSPEPPAELC